MTRRAFLAGAGLFLAAARAGPRGDGGDTAMETRPIPRSGEKLPVVGLGTWKTFDVKPGPDRAPLADVLRRFFAVGGKVIDSSPMYGGAEAAVGDLLREGGWLSRPFIATKVWTSGREAGERQMAESIRRMGGRVDLMQVHNLVDWRTHLPALRSWKEAGRIRYIGVTHYAPSAFEELERILRNERVDFVQLPYSVAEREAEARLLPAAVATGTAVIVMRPFEAGGLFRAVRGRPLPPIAAELGCRSWGQLFLKFVLANPAVTCAIPATANPDHLLENIEAGTGPLPGAGARRKILDAAGFH